MRSLKLGICILFLLPFLANAEGHSKTEAQQKFAEAIGYVQSKDYLQAFDLFSELSDDGFPEAQYNLSLLYFSGLGSPKNFKLSLYWSWMAHLNLHETALERVNASFDKINEALRNAVAQQIADELKILANEGDKNAPLKLGKTFLGLFVEPNYESAYVWLSIAQAYGDDQAPNYLDQAASNLEVDIILAQQEEAQKVFQAINSEN